MQHGHLLCSQTKTTSPDRITQCFPDDIGIVSDNINFSLNSVQKLPPVLWGGVVPIHSVLKKNQRGSEIRWFRGPFFMITPRLPKTSLERFRTTIKLLTPCTHAPNKGEQSVFFGVENAFPTLEKHIARSYADKADHVRIEENRSKVVLRCLQFQSKQLPFTCSNSIKFKSGFWPTGAYSKTLRVLTFQFMAKLASLLFYEEIAQETMVYVASLQEPVFSLEVLKIISCLTKMKFERMKMQIKTSDSIEKRFRSEQHH